MFGFWLLVILRIKREPFPVHDGAAVHGWAVLTYAVGNEAKFASRLPFRFGVSVVVHGYPDAAGE